MIWKSRNVWPSLHSCWDLFTRSSTSKSLCLAASKFPYIFFYNKIDILNNCNVMMMNCFYGMVDRRKVFSLISSRNHCQRSSPTQISDTRRAGFEPAQNLSSGLVEWRCAVVITWIFQCFAPLTLIRETCSSTYQCIKVLTLWLPDT